MYTLKFYSFLFVLGSILFSCSKDKYEAEIPSYISIDNFSLITDYATEGSNSENISDAWVYINDDLVGVFELPAKFPVLKEGNFSMKVYAGIKENGIASNRRRYLAYAPHIQDIVLERGEEISISPQVTYEPSAKFAWLEDFENTSLTFLYHANSDTIINKDALDVKEGNFSGQIFLDPEMTFFETTSTALTGVPLNGSSPVYLELDYKSNQAVIVGIYLDASQYAYLTLNVNHEWTKIYINLEDVISENIIGSADFKVFVGMSESSSYPFVATPEVNIDNIKLVHF